MSYLVTGGTGLIGSRVVRDLVRSGEQVVVYDLFPDNDFLGMVMGAGEVTKVKVIQGDLTDFAHLLAIVKDNNIDVIIHLAATLAQYVRENPRWAVRVNVDGTMNIFELARLLGLRKVVWASSSAVFAGGSYDTEYIPNDAPHYPWGLYGICKAFGEDAGDYYFQEFGTDITAIRYGAMIYGAGMRRGFVSVIFQQLVLNPALGKPGKVSGGDDTTGWLYVDDAARAALMASKVPRTKTGAFSVMGQIHAIRELAGYVKELIPNAKIDLEKGSSHWPSFKLETSATEQEIGFHPQWTIRQGIKETINLTRQWNGLPLV